MVFVSEREGVRREGEILHGSLSPVTGKKLIKDYRKNKEH